ncbi:MAG: DUF177 domain-containing protein [Algoriphagus sp.]|uniref:YceD family protein n=1 Tax=Algoriphagus sp. TaxID=1872435 RepID=UPI0026083A40|nr:DUF177 domain-containing protein [Algoriphagus sp.]MDG1276368.1 DUF177 domain-containing protein [Algoriphagus sp.]
MKFLRTFDIEVIKFLEGKHEIDFEIGKEFFQHFEDNELLDEGHLTVRVLMDKGANLIEMDFLISGEVKLVCDRSLEEFFEPLDLKEKIIFKYGDEEQEINEDVYMITRDTPKINVAQFIYEFVLLGLPAKRIHPDYRTEMDEDDYEGEGMYAYIDGDTFEDEETEEEINSEKQEEESTDPRWELLKKLKNKE